MPKYSPLSWSFSRHNQREACARQYFFNYYAVAEGWKPNATKLSKRAFQLKQLSGYHGWKGDLVHRAIAYYLQTNRVHQVQAKKANFTRAVKKATDYIDIVATSEWAQSIDHLNNPEAFPPTKRHFVLKEHFDGKGGRYAEQSFFDNMLDEVVDQTVVALDWLRDDMKKGDKVLTTEVLSEYRGLGPVPAWVKLDLVVERKNGDLHNIDWKTGRVKEQHALQMAVYWHYLCATYGKELPEVETTLVYLSSVAATPIPVDTPTFADMSSVEDFAQRSMVAQKKLLSNPKTNTPLPVDNFPICDTTRECSVCNWCNYRSICKD